MRCVAAAAGADEVNAGLKARQSTVTSASSRYQPGYSADGVVDVVEHVERIGTKHARTTAHHRAPQRQLERTAEAKAFKFCTRVLSKR